MEVFSLLTYGQVECFLLSCFMKIDFNQPIHINMIYDNSGCEISGFHSPLHALKCYMLRPCHADLMLTSSMFFIKVCQDTFSVTLIEMVGLNITLTREIAQKAKIFVQTNV